MKNKDVVTLQVAINDLKEFLRPHKKKEFKKGIITSEYIEKEYPDVLEVIQSGLLTFPNSNAVYDLQYPIKDSEGNPFLTNIRFRSRVKYVDRMRVMDGLDFTKQQGTYILKLLSLTTQISVAELEKLDDDDILILNQLSTVF